MIVFTVGKEKKLIDPSHKKVYVFLVQGTLHATIMISPKWFNSEPFQLMITQGQ